MAKRKLREDKTCLNCGCYVEKHFCSSCGQENIEPHFSCFHLFKHFIEDLVHYESSFWKSIRLLLFYPNKLTEEYLNGKRKKYIDPIKLYIFISFVAFFIPPLLPDFSETATTGHNGAFSKEIEHNGLYPRTINISVDSLKILIHKYETVAALDSAEMSLPKEKRLTFVEYYALSKAIKSNTRIQKTLEETFVESLGHNFPKVLFVYMPIFAFLLWLLHNKKKWLFYDSAVFTLHFFSFVLLLITIGFIVMSLLTIGDNGLFSFLNTVIGLLIFLYPPIYFFIAHRRMYKEHILLSDLKSTILIFVNFMFITFVLLAYTFITFVIVIN